MKTTRVGGGHPEYKVLADATGAARTRAAFQQDLWHYTLAKMVDACASAGIKPFYGPFGDFSDPEACEAQFRNAFLMGCVGAWTLHPSQIPIAKRVFSPDPAEIAFAKKIAACHAGRKRCGHDRRQDAGRRHLEAGQGALDLARLSRRQGSAARGALRSLMLGIAMSKTRNAKFQIGQVVRHRLFPFRGVVFDIDPEFNNTEEWYQVHPGGGAPNQGPAVLPFIRGERGNRIHRLRVGAESLPDTSGEPVRHPQVAEVFEQDEKGSYRPRHSC